MFAEIKNAPVWMRNLWVCTIVSFIVSAGMSQMAPILPLYIRELGITDHESLSAWSGIVFGCTFISLALFAPVWGILMDRHGAKPMQLRASFGLAVCMCLMGVAQNVWQLAGFRLLQGVLSGFVGAVTTMVMAQAPRERTGWAMSVLVTGQISGNLVGPLIGGWLSQVATLRGNFFIMAGCALLGFLLILFLVQEDFKPSEIKASATWRERFGFPLTRPVLVLFSATFVLQFALMSMAPVLTVFIHQMIPESRHVAVISGCVFASTALASIMSATTVGKYMDAHGPARVLPVLLLCAGFICIPQAFTHTPLELGGLRFLFGLAIVGIVPAVNSMLKAQSRTAYVSRVYGANYAAQSLGIFSGSVVGGQVAAMHGVPAVFFLGGGLLLLNALLFVCLYPRANGGTAVK